jgi:hypothetical protein
MDERIENVVQSDYTGLEGVTKDECEQVCWDKKGFVTPPTRYFMVNRSLDPRLK